MDNILSSLNQSQREAVEYVDGPELVIAGAGSGKTRVLTYKIAYLISLGIKPWSILALTFTNKAAREMKERVSGIVGADNARNIHMGTFHSVFLRILRAEAPTVGLSSNFTIYDDSDQRALVNSIVKELALDDKVYKASTVLSRIGMAKNNLIVPEAYMSDASIAERDLRSNMPKLGMVYLKYTQRCRMANALDFDDMLLFTYSLFANHKEVLDKYAGRYSFVLVDEYQDTNYAQQSILTLLTRKSGNICVVGDDAQSIYAFRGANIDNILNFMNIYQGAATFKLEQNYRSTQCIVGAANSLISHNQRQIPKNVFSQNPIGEKVKINVTYSDKEEASYVCGRIRRIHKLEDVAYDGMAILYRTNAQSRLFEEELRRENIPYRIYGGLSFYQRKEIKDVIAYFRLVANPNDEEALKRVINYPKRGIGDATVDKIIVAARKYSVPLWSVVQNPMGYGVTLSTATSRRVFAFYSMIQGFVEKADSADVCELGRRIVEESGVSSDLASGKNDDAKDKMENLDEFMSGLRDFVDTKREEGRVEETLISNFLQEVSLMTDADKDNDDEGRDVVSLMTVHASKGLEFDTVFVVGLEENLFPSGRVMSSLRELEEERRLLYVAITRAEQRCYLSCAKSRYQYGNLQFNPPSRFLKEIDTKWVEISGGKLLGGVDSDTTVVNTKVNANGYCRSGRVAVANIPDASRYRRISTGKTAHAPGAAVSRVVEPAQHSVMVGTKIEHVRFGIGTVMNVEGSGENEKATVDFQNVGRKTLLLKFARFKALP